MRAERRVVVVTGATAGIGRAVVREYAAQGAWLGLLARGADGLEATRAEVEQLGGRALAISCDVADADAVERAAATVEAELGAIDVWINNAMASMFAPVSNMTPDEVARVTAVTYLGAVNGTMAALKRMRARDRGVIVQVGSLLAHRAIPLQSAYCAAKHALRGFSESLRCELMNEQSRVAVTMVQLPAVNTPQFSWVRTRVNADDGDSPQPMGKVYEPEPMAKAIVHAADHPRPEVLVGGSILAPYLGQKLAPRLLDRKLARDGVSGQLVAPRIGPREGNLFAPVPGDHGARGEVKSRVLATSAQAWLNRHRPLVAAALALAGVAVGVGLVRRRR